MIADIVYRYQGSAPKILINFLPHLCRFERCPFPKTQNHEARLKLIAELSKCVKTTLLSECEAPEKRT